MGNLVNDVRLANEDKLICRSTHSVDAQGGVPGMGFRGEMREAEVDGALCGNWTPPKRSGGAFAKNWPGWRCKSMRMPHEQYLLELAQREKKKRPGR